MADTTILTHLAHYVAEGELSLADIIDAPKLAAVQAAIRRVGIDSNLKAIKDLCPADVTYTEIGIITQLMKNGNH